MSTLPTMPPYYKHHVFFCLNIRTPDSNKPNESVRQCCGGETAIQAQQYAKQRIAQLNLNQVGQVRINQSGCLDRCEQGPCVVIYPQGTWYTYIDNADIDTIIDTHIIAGEVATDLQIL
jgi:(2Fe-2S) ferredoxin